jgi:cell wall-associated NlpC family hydrolase
MEDKIEKVIKIAKGLIGKKYKYGAKPEEAPEFFDCSSFIQYVFKQIGINLPRSSIEQIEHGKFVKRLRKGDLVFFRGKKFHVNEKWPEGVGHVALYIGNNKVIHAFGNKGEVCISRLKDLLHYKIVAKKRIL